MMLKLSQRTQNLLNDYFPEKLRTEARELIESECGNNIPLCEAIELAQTDWRDLLMAAGFGNDPQEHNKWYNDQYGTKPWWKIW